MVSERFFPLFIVALLAGKFNAYLIVLVWESQRTVDYFSPQTISIGDLVHLYAYWAHLEATLGEDFVAARGVWESLIKKSGSVLEVWQGYIAMEVRMSHINEARSIYKRCYSKRFQGTGSEDICHSWLRFEREYGTLADLDLVVKKVTPRLQELMAYKTQQDSKGFLSTEKDGPVPAIAPKKRKANNTNADKLTPSKKRKDVEIERSEPPLDVRAGTSSIMDDVKAYNQQEETVQDIGEHKLKGVGDSKLNKTMPFYTDKCTAFISNLSLQANENHLHRFFMDSGGVTAIRLLRDKFSGKSRGLAYVDFSDEEHLAAAIAKNKQKLLGKGLSIARSDPKQSRNKSFPGSTSSLGRGKGESRRDQKGIDEAFGAPPREEKPARNITFATPRAVAKPLGWSRKDSQTEAEAAAAGEKPKSNDEFREMFLKK